MKSIHRRLDPVRAWRQRLDTAPLPMLLGSLAPGHGEFRATQFVGGPTLPPSV